MECSLGPRRRIGCVAVRVYAGREDGYHLTICFCHFALLFLYTKTPSALAIHSWDQLSFWVIRRNDIPF